MAEIVIFNDCNGPLGFSRYAGPYRIATELRLNGFEVQIIEFFGDMTVEEVFKVINKHIDNTTLWVGMASTLFGKHLTKEDDIKLWLTPPMGGLKQLNDVFQTLFPHSDKDMISFIDRIKEINPKTKMVCGGYKSLHKDFPAIDYWILGQGENSAVAVSKHLKYGEELLYVDTELGRVITDKMYEFTKFNTCKITWDKSDHITWGEDLQIETARGCIFKCAFCAFNLNGKKFGDFTKTPNVLREELLYNYENFGTTGYMVADDTVNDSMHKIEFLHKVFTDLPFKPRLSCHLRLDVIARQPRMITLLHEMGLSSANFGIETFNQTAGKAIGKGADPELLKETLFRLQEEWGDDVFTSANFIAGLPHETIDSLKSTFDWLHRPDVPLHGLSVNRLYISQVYPAINPPNFTDEQMINWGFIKGKRGWQYNNVSQMEVDAGKFNLEYGEEKFFMWKGEHLTAKTADILVDEFYADSTNADKKFSLTMFLNYNRIMNLGYTRDQIKDMYQNDPDTVVECINRRHNLRKDYLKKILR